MESNLATVVLKSIESGLVVAGRKGVTNKQMLEVFKTNPNEESLLQLLKDFPEVFKNSVKYTPDKQKVKLEKLIQENGYPDFTVKTGKKIRMITTTDESNSDSDTKTSDDNIVNQQSVEETQDDQNGESNDNSNEEVADEEKVSIILLDSYKNHNNEKMAQVAKKLELLSDEELRMVKAMVEQDLGITELAKSFGLTKDQAYSRLFRNKNSVYNRLKEAN